MGGGHDHHDDHGHDDHGHGDGHGHDDHGHGHHGPDPYLVYPSSGHGPERESLPLSIIAFVVMVVAVAVLVMVF